MHTQKELVDRSDLVHLLTVFYQRVFEDSLIGPVFTDVASLNITEHVELIADFWESKLWSAGKYHENALQKHRELDAAFNLEFQHFERWLLLFCQTVDQHFYGEQAEKIKRLAQRIANYMQQVLEQERLEK